MIVGEELELLSEESMKAWAESTLEKLKVKMRIAVAMAAEEHFIPYSTKDGKWSPTGIGWWTNGFWGALMWQMFLLTKENAYRDAAVRAEEMMDAVLKEPEKLHHDVGFMWLIQSGVRYALEGDPDSLSRALRCADILAARFNPNGFIRAWNGDDRIGTGIIDTMMNLSLLYWASRITKDPRYRLTAERHADTALKYFVRPDGTCNHIVRFNPVTGEYIDNPGGQGYESGSSWSRGQAWGLYGFTLSYRMTGKKEYLEAAKRIANAFITACQPEWVPYCDFRAPKEPKIYDNAAGAIAACGLLEMIRHLPELQREPYRLAASQLLLAMDKKCADWSDKTPAILQMCTGAYHDKPSRHITMVYADYYFVEAVSRLLGGKMLFWGPDLKEDMTSYGSDAL